ncbi:Fanconi anemia group F protein [Coregonus clupeaformis]|uniref:Fanconi anemia group F protein n=1 Tax=Coregonus clupeaformis TaxID=59861 RepID=UPI001E1C701E|nr:Fanconi anemia group F protein [Coregonus clupeaformis]
MEAVVKNLERTAELLAVSQTEIVQRWDKQTLDRAFQWTQYCEHLYTRFHANTTVRDILEKQLQVTNESLRTTFQGYTDITFSDLSQCQHLLLVGLLNNAAVPSSVIKQLFDTSCSKTVGDKSKDATGHCTELIEVKSACKVLSAIYLKGSTSFPGPDADVVGTTLMEMLDILLSPATGGSNVGLAEKLLDSILQTCGEYENFSGVVAAALLSRKNNSATAAASATTAAASATTSGGVSLDFILDWLQQHHSLLQHMCSTLPIGLLMDLYRQSVRFRVTYCDMLKQWGSQLEYDMGEGEWVQVFTTNGVSFKTLSDHYRSLLGACPSMEEDIERELTELRVADGDFDVRGLSVWGDLLSELNKV